MSDAAPSFELTSGALCLDFANTWGDRGRPTTDSLRTFWDLVAFARQAGIVGDEAGRRMVERAEADPNAATTVLSRCREVRESLYNIFSAVSQSVAPQSEDLATLNQALPGALQALRLQAQGARFAWSWPGGGASLDAPLGPILFDAAELLTSEERARIRECAGTDCTWLFLDGSRNGSRRWCSMETCGNRAKARRHYRRQVSGEGPAKDRRP